MVLLEQEFLDLRKGNKVGAGARGSALRGAFFVYTVPFIKLCTLCLVYCKLCMRPQSALRPPYHSALHTHTQTSLYISLISPQVRLCSVLNVVQNLFSLKTKKPIEVQSRPRDVEEENEASFVCEAIKLILTFQGL